MTRINYIFKELFRSVIRNPGTLLASFLSLAFLFLLFDLFWVAAGSSHQFYNELLSEMRVEVFITEDLPDSVVVPIRESLTGVAGIAGVQYVSRDQARKELSRLVGTDLLVGYDSLNPLPRSFLLAINPDQLNLQSMEEIENHLYELQFVDQIYYSRRWLDKAETMRATIIDVGVWLGLLLLVTALISSANSIRLMTRSRAVGFQQMRLLGAGRFFLSAPFLIEGFFISAMAAAVGWVAIWYGSQKIEFTRFDLVMPTIEQMIIYCAAAALVGLFSAMVGIRKLVR